MSEPSQIASERPGDSCTIVIFGAAGDLTKRKLVPALCNLQAYGLMPREFAIVGVARKDMTTTGFREQLSRDIKQFATAPVDPKSWSEFEKRLFYVAGDFGDPTTYKKLSDQLTEIARKYDTGGSILFYLSTPPDAFTPVVQNLGKMGLNRAGDGRWRRIIVEKPFGRDLNSAVALNNQLHEVLDENQIYRIDHYLGKETVQNILVFRFGNGIFEPIWNRRYIDHVQIMVAEDLGVEGRGRYYDQAGVLRDVIQNHMFQLLTLVAMEPPISFEGEGVRNEKVKVLNAIRPWQPEEILRRTVRGQYGEGFIGGEKAPAYRSEGSVAPNSKTETYAALKLSVDNWRWAGVPFYLRSGKRLVRKDTEIVIQFNRPPLSLFRQTGVEKIESNRLILHVQPEEGIRVRIKAKRPGPTIRLETVELAFSYKDFGEQVKTTGYERLLYDCMIGDSTQFHREDMVESAWRVVTPILDLWASQPAPEFPNYAAGSWGPAAADEMMQRDGRHWIVSE